MIILFTIILLSVSALIILRLWDGEVVDRPPPPKEVEWLMVHKKTGDLKVVTTEQYTISSRKLSSDWELLDYWEVK